MFSKCKTEFRPLFGKYFAYVSLPLNINLFNNFLDPFKSSTDAFTSSDPFGSSFSTQQNVRPIGFLDIPFLTFSIF